MRVLRPGLYRLLLSFLTRSNAFGCVADLLHHLRSDLSPPQLTRVCGAFLRHFHNPYLSNQMHILSAKMIYNVIEVIVAKETHPAAARLLTAILEASVDKLESMAVSPQGRW